MVKRTAAAAMAIAENNRIFAALTFSVDKSLVAPRGIADILFFFLVLFREKFT